MVEVTLEEFHQMVLFMIMDIPIPDGVTYIAVDHDGEIYGYDRRPTINELEGAWLPTHDLAESYPLDKNVDEMLPTDHVLTKIPVTVDWRECIWTI